MQDAKEAAVAALLNIVGWNCVPGDMLHGCIAMYRATGEEYFQSAVLLHMYMNITARGAFCIDTKLSGNYGGYGNALLFSLDETGDELFKSAAESLFNQFTSLTASNHFHLTSFPHDSETADLSSFIIAYDTRFGKKQSYKEITRWFAQMHERYYSAEKGLYRLPDDSNDRNPFSAEGVMLSSLVDTLENMDEQLYEHYRALADRFLTAARGLIRYQDQSGVLRAVIDAGDGDRATGKILYALQKGVRLHLLDEEKYAPVIEKTYAAWLEELKERTIRFEREGACMMANGEMKMREEKKK